MSNADGIDVIGKVSESDYLPDEFDTTKEYLSTQLETDVYRADENPGHISQGDTVMVVATEEGHTAYIADNPSNLGKADEVVEHGNVVDRPGSASADQYGSEVLDNVAAMYGLNLAAKDGNVQNRRGESTNASLEPEQEHGDWRIQRVLEEDQ
ncbi:MAG: hypothetical protein J07AB43_15650 [Candidatus Nanosalina sp. J07AB43]|jgi:hypothetical protein|nr:MAG: hypothetical protein J07AB43_15650 [Candidatus Nanosalina sp. J07AB43]